MAELGKGGMGKMRVHLMNAIVEAGYSVDLVLGKRQALHRLELDERIRVVELGTSHALFGVPRLAWYLRRHRPRVLLTQRIRVNVLAHRARALARAPTRIFATGNTHQSTALQRFPDKERKRRLKRLQHYFARNDGMISVSRGVADDYARLIDWDPGAIAVAPNPVVVPGLADRAREPVDHPWFQPGEPPVILSIGRLQVQKDYPTLLRAFARFRQRHEARLVILGEGPRRDEIAAEAEALGVSDSFAMPGFVSNVYAYLARSRMFVLSSAWEGSPNVLVEAMAVGTPVVATNCPSGPEEILEGGHLAPLVPVGSPQELADAMERIWRDPPDPDTLGASVDERYSAAQSAAAYICALGLDEPTEPAPR